MAIDYNPFYPEAKQDPYPYYAALRAEAPVHRISDTDVFAVSRYEDVSKILERPTEYSSAEVRRGPCAPHSKRDCPSSNVATLRRPRKRSLLA